MNKSKGFTLVEIAVVLIVVGLLMGAILKGQELITQAKIRNIANELNGVTAAVLAYQDRYRQVPGDDATAAARWPAAGGIAAAVDGDGNRTVGAAAVAAAACAAAGVGENCTLWNHLRRSGLIVGGAASNETPLNAAAGFLHVQTAGLGLAGLIVCTTNLSGKIAGAIDTQLDDGNPATGTLRAGAGLATNAAAAAYVDDGGTLYTICKTI